MMGGMPISVSSPVQSTLENWIAMCPDKGHTKSTRRRRFRFALRVSRPEKGRHGHPRQMVVFSALDSLGYEPGVATRCLQAFYF